MEKNNLPHRILTIVAPLIAALGLTLPFAFKIQRGDALRAGVGIAEAQAQKDANLGEMLPKNLFIWLGKKVNPAVVNISTTQVIRGMNRGMGPYPMMPLPNDPFRQFFEDFMGQQMQAPEEKVQSLGSGFIIESNGLIVTNFHVIQNATEIQVQLTENSKRKYMAKVIGSDKRTDIALIKIGADGTLPTVPLGDSDKVEVGEWVAAFGNPFGHGHSMTKGIISAKDRDIEIDPNVSYAFLQTDASINPGNSGGPLVNSSGEVIGVNSAIDARAQGIGFAIPINVVKHILPTLKSRGRIVRGFLGVGINNIDERMVKQFHLKNDKGVIVTFVTPGSPADRAGVKPYDIITKFNGKEINTARELTAEVGDLQIGASASVEILREGKSLGLTAKITERPDEMAQSGPGEEQGESGSFRGKAAPFKLGMSLMDLTPQVAREFDLHDVPQSGVVIAGIRQGSIAEEAGIMVGDVILDVNRHAVRTTKEALKAFRKGSNNLRILRDGQTIIVFMDVE